MSRQKTASVVSDINVTPMVDVMLVMLIIFMVITPMLTKGVQVDLVKTKNPIAMQEADKDDAVLVSVNKNGEVFLGSTKTTAEALPAKVKDLLTNRISKICFLKCDQRSRYEKVVEVVDNLRAAGVDQVGLLTESMDPKSHDGAAGAAKAPGGGI